jgi:hypothetical protein
VSLPFIPKPRENEVLFVSQCEGAFVVEPMRFLWPQQARERALRQKRKAAA